MSGIRGIAWKLVERKVLVENRWGSVEHNDYRTPEREEVRDYLVVRRRPFVVVVAEDGERVLLIRQYRAATDKVYLCLPAGYCGEGEDPLSTGARELLEESGFAGHSFSQLAVLDPLPGYVSSPCHVLCCRLGSRGALTDPDAEVLEVVLAPWERVLADIRAGAIDEMQAVVALLLAHDRR